MRILVVEDAPKIAAFFGQGRPEAGPPTTLVSADEGVHSAFPTA